MRTQIEGERNIIIQQIDGSSIQVAINETDEMLKLLDEWGEQLEESNIKNRDLLRKNIVLLESVIDNQFLPFKIDEFDKEVHHLTEGFIGRESELKEISDFVYSHSKGTFFVFGSPGIGKSSLSAQLVRQLENNHLLDNNSSLLVIPYFIRRGTESAQLNTFLTYLSQQLESLLKTGIKAGNTIDSIRVNLHKRLQLAGTLSAGQKIVLIIDGLDEGTETGVLDNLFREVYENVIVIFSSRYTDPVQDLYFQYRNLSGFGMLPLRGLPKEKVQKIIQRLAGKYEISEKSFDQLIINSQGNPKYLELLELSLEKGILVLTETAEIPKFTDDFDNFYDPLVKSYTKHEFGNFILSCLYCLSVAKDYLNTYQLGKILHLNSGDIGKAIFVLKEVLIKKTDARNNEYYQLFHESLREYLVHREYYNLLDSKYRLVDFCKKWNSYRPFFLKEYPMKFYASHLMDLTLNDHDQATGSALLKLAHTEEFVEVQIDVTKHFFYSFELYKKALQILRLKPSHTENIAIALKVCQLYEAQLLRQKDILFWISSGTITAIDEALQRINSFSTEDKVNAYAILLYTFLYGDEKNNSKKVDICKRIINSLDVQVERTGRELSPFQYWLDFYIESKRIGISIPFLRGRIEPWTYSMDSSHRYSPMQEYIMNQSFANVSEVEESIGLVFEVYIYSQEMNLDFGTTNTMKAIRSCLVEIARKSKNLDIEVSIFEKNISTYIGPLNEETSSNDGISKLYFNEEYLSILNKVAIEFGDQLKMKEHIDQTMDSSNYLSFKLSLAEHYFNQGQLEDSKDELSEIIAYLDKSNTREKVNVELLCRLLLLLDKEKDPIVPLVLIVDKIFKQISLDKYREVSLVLFFECLLKTKNISVVIIEKYTGAVIKLKTFYERPILTDLYTRLFIEDEITVLDRLNGFEQLNKYYDEINFIDELIQIYENVSSLSLPDKAAQLNEYTVTRIFNLENYYRKNKLSLSDLKTQEARFLLRLGTLVSICDPSGIKLIENAIKINEKEYVREKIFRSGVIEFFPHLIKIKNSNIQDYFLNFIREINIEELGEYERFDLLKAFLELGFIEEAVEVMKYSLSIPNETTKLIKSIKLFIFYNYENRLFELSIRKRLAADYATIISSKFKVEFIRLISESYIESLQSESRSTLNLVNQLQVTQSVTKGLIRNNHEISPEVELVIKNKKDLLVFFAKNSIEKNYSKIRYLLKEIGNLFVGVAFDKTKLEWVGTSDNERLLIQETAELALYLPLALKVYEEDGISITTSIINFIFGEEKERICKNIVRRLLHGKLTSAAIELTEEHLISCKSMAFWEDFIYGLMNSKKTCDLALKYLEHIHYVKGSRADDRRMELYLELLAKYYDYERYIDVIDLCSRIKLLPCFEERLADKAFNICHLLNFFSIKQSKVNTCDELLLWIKDQYRQSERNLEKMKVNSTWLLYYLGEYQEALSMYGLIEEKDDLDMYLLSEQATKLIWRDHIEDAIKVIKLITTDNDKEIPVDTAVRHLLKKGDILKAIQVLKLMDDFENELLIKTILNTCSSEDLPLLKQFIFEELTNSPEEVKNNLKQAFLIKSGEFPSIAQKWIDDTLIDCTENINNLTTSLLVEYYRFDESIGADIEFKNTIGKVLNLK